MTAGKVYLVGAGPGHPDLMTLRAARLIREADVIVYDRLIQDDVLVHANPAAERLFMGKVHGCAAMQQEQIHELLLSRALAGKTVVRLKGGDPFMFGRGGEEAAFLASHGIEVEVVPGVSSLLAAPAAAGIPVTHRGISSCVAFVTGHEMNDDQTCLDWAALARMPTLVFVMAVHNLRRIATRLMDNGRDAATPAAIVQMAYWQDQQVVTATLGTIADEAARAGIQPPATLVIGDVVRLGALLGGARELALAAQD